MKPVHYAVCTIMAAMIKRRGGTINLLENNTLLVLVTPEAVSNQIYTNPNVAQNVLARTCYIVSNQHEYKLEA